VAGEITLSVNPSGFLHRGMSIIIRCLVRYGGPSVISSVQDPTVELMLDHEESLPRGQIYYEAPADTENVYTKTLVSFKGF